MLPIPLCFFGGARIFKIQSKFSIHCSLFYRWSTTVCIVVDLARFIDFKRTMRKKLDVLALHVYNTVDFFWYYIFSTWYLRNKQINIPLIYTQKKRTMHQENFIVYNIVSQSAPTLANFKTKSVVQCLRINILRLVTNKFQTLSFCKKRRNSFIYQEQSVVVNHNGS